MVKSSHPPLVYYNSPIQRLEFLYWRGATHPLSPREGTPVTGGGNPVYILTALSSRQEKKK